ncbi:MAG: hypothetical protein ACRDH9_01870 [Actinomycetota bacterium]
MYSSERPRGRGFPSAWFISGLRDVPERWRSRAVPGILVSLLPEETDKVLGAAGDEIEPEDVPLLGLVARGLTVAAIARTLGIPIRTLNRRLAELREEFEVGSTTELTGLLARRGFWYEAEASQT